MAFMQFTEDQEALVELADEIGRKEFAAHMLDWAESHELPWKNIELLRDAGLIGLSIDSKYGGGDRSPFDSLLVTETLSTHCPVTGALANSLDLGPTGIINYLGSEDQKSWLLPRLLAGGVTPAIGLTEPEAGSALSSLRTTARRDGEECILNGSKVFTSHADVADVFFVYCRFGPANEDIGCVIVERGTPGFTIGGTQTHMSGETWAPLYFDNCVVPGRNILPIEHGFRDLISIYSLERTAAAAKLVGLGQCALNRAIEYATDRQQFGQRIGDFQGIRWKFADMALRLESARLLTYRAVANAVEGRPVRRESSMAKLAASEAACYVCDEAIQIFGGYGVSRETGMEWLYRRARGYRIAGGTSEIHRNMIGLDVLRGR